MGKHYICMNCGTLFKEGEGYYIEEKEKIDGRTYVTGVYEACPECKSEDLEEAVECPVCGEYHSTEDDDIICNDCRIRIEALWQEMLDKLEDGTDAGEVGRYIVEVLI